MPDQSDNDILDTLLTEFDTASMNEGFRPQDLVAAHVVRAIELLIGDTDPEIGVPLSAVLSRQLVNTAQSLIARKFNAQPTA